MYTFNIPPKKVSTCQAKLDFYSEQTDELLETSRELRLAHELVKSYSVEDAAYYLQMYVWLNRRYDYVMEYSLTFIPWTGIGPTIYEKH